MVICIIVNGGYLTIINSGYLHHYKRWLPNHYQHWLSASMVIVETLQAFCACFVAHLHLHLFAECAHFNNGIYMHDCNVKEYLKSNHCDLRFFFLKEV